MTLSSLLTLGITGASSVLLLLNRSLAEKDTLVSVLTVFVVILLVCKHPASLTTNTVIPFRDSFSSRKNKKNRLRTYLNMLCTEKMVFSFFRFPQNRMHLSKVQKSLDLPSVFTVFPSVGLNHGSGCVEWCDSGVKACF